MPRLPRYFIVCFLLVFAAFCLYGNAEAKSKRSKSSKPKIQSSQSVKSAKHKYSASRSKRAKMETYKAKASKAEVYGRAKKSRGESYRVRLSKADSYRVRSSRTYFSRRKINRSNDPRLQRIERDIYAQIASHYGDKIPAQVALSIKPTDGDLSSEFGWRKLGRRSSMRMHKGVDFSAHRGTPVVASASGVVTFVGRQGAYGKMVEIDHGKGMVTRYAHLDNFTVSEGDRVGGGRRIGTVGTTGRTTGANLHFEVLVNDKNIDPMRVANWNMFADRSESGRSKKSTYKRHYGSKS